MNVEEQLKSQLLLEAKQMGFSDKQIAVCIGSTELAIRSKREEYGNHHIHNQVNICVPVSIAIWRW